MHLDNELLGVIGLQLGMAGREGGEGAGGRISTLATRLILYQGLLRPSTTRIKPYTSSKRVVIGLDGACVLGFEVPSVL